MVFEKALFALKEKNIIPTNCRMDTGFNKPTTAIIYCYNTEPSSLSPDDREFIINTVKGADPKADIFITHESELEIRLRWND
jgi:hypothetical protein